MTLRNSDLQSDSDLDSIRNSCDVFQKMLCLAESKSHIHLEYRPSLTPKGKTQSYPTTVYHPGHQRMRKTYKKKNTLNFQCRCYKKTPKTLKGLERVFGL